MADRIEVDLIVEAISKGFDQVGREMGKLERSQRGVNKETKKSDGIFKSVQQNWQGLVVGGAAVAWLALR